MTEPEERKRLERARIFISYRRRETAGHAGRLYDKLSEHFGADRVFMDLTMEPGVDFADTINEAVGECGALVALIGDEWLTVTDASGRRRIDDPTDIHRMEIEAALDRKVLLIPALVQDAAMPTADDLPDPLDPLVRRQSVELSDQRWDYDVGRLVAVLERALHEAGGAGGRGRRTADRLRRLAYRYRGRAGFAAGVLGTLVVVGTALAATGYFESPLLRVTSFDYTPPAPGDSFAQRCVVRAESDYRVKNARFVVTATKRTRSTRRRARRGSAPTAAGEPLEHLPRPQPRLHALRPRPKHTSPRPSRTRRATRPAGRGPSDELPRPLRGSDPS